MNNNKYEKKSVKIPNISKTETSPNLSLDSNEDLLVAIKQVAKEMAEAVKKTEKEIEKARQETERKDNEAKEMTYPHRVQTSIQSDAEEEPKSKTPSKVLCDIPSRSKTISAVLSSSAPDRISDEELVEHPNIDEEADEDDLQGENDTYPRYEDYKVDHLEIETDYVKKSFYERKVESYNKIQQKLELQRNKKITEELKYMQSKPKLTQATKKIIMKKLPDYEPIYNRIDEEIFKKNQNLEILKYSLADLERSKKPHNASRLNTGYADKQQIGNFIKTQNEWKKKRDEKISNIKNEIEKFEDEASKYLFQPAILKSSDIMAQNKIIKNKDKEVHKRLYNLHEENLKKKKKMEMKTLPSFKPNVNKNLPNYLKRIEKEKDSAPSEKIEEFVNKDMWEDYIDYEKADDNPKLSRNKNTKSVPKKYDKYNLSERYDDDHDHNINNILNKINHQMCHKENKPIKYDKPDCKQENLYNEDAIIKAYKDSMEDMFYSQNSTPIRNDTYKVYSIQDKRTKNAAESDWRYAIPKLSPPTKNIDVDEGLNNLNKINLQDKTENKISTPQFATMIKKNFNIIACAKVKSSK